MDVQLFQPSSWSFIQMCRQDPGWFLLPSKGPGQISLATQCCRAMNSPTFVRLPGLCLGLLQSPFSEPVFTWALLLLSTHQSHRQAQEEATDDQGCTGMFPGLRTPV